LHAMIPLKVVKMSSQALGSRLLGNEVLNSIIFVTRLINGTQTLVLPADTEVVRAAKTANTLGFNLLNSTYSLVIVNNMFVTLSFLHSQDENNTNNSIPKNMGLAIIGGNPIGGLTPGQVISVEVKLTNITLGSELVEYNTVQIGLFTNM